MILMTVVLYSLLSKSRLRRLAIRFSTHTGASYSTRERTTLTYSWHTPTPAPPIFGNKPHKELAAAVFLGTKSLKCVRWGSGISSEAPPRCPPSLYSNTGRAEESPRPPVIKPDSLRLSCEHPHTQPAYGTHRASDDKLVVMQCLVPPTSSGQEQHIASVRRHACVRWHETAKHRVVADDPQNSAEHRARRIAGPLHRCRCTDPPVAQVGSDNTNKVRRHLEEFKGLHYPILRYDVERMDYV